MKNFRCEKCSKIFSIEDEAKCVCPKCGNEDVNTLYEINDEDMEIISADKKKRHADNKFHAILFGVCALVIVVLTVIILVLQVKGGY